MSTHRPAHVQCKGMACTTTYSYCAVHVKFCILDCFVRIQGPEMMCRSLLGLPSSRSLLHGNRVDFHQRPGRQALHCKCCPRGLVLAERLSVHLVHLRRGEEEAMLSRQASALAVQHARTSA